MVTARYGPKFYKCSLLTNLHFLPQFLCCCLNPPHPPTFLLSLPVCCFSLRPLPTGSKLQTLHPQSILLSWNFRLHYFPLAQQYTLTCSSFCAWNWRHKSSPLFLITQNIAQCCNKPSNFVPWRLRHQLLLKRRIHLFVILHLEDTICIFLRKLRNNLQYYTQP